MKRMLLAAGAIAAVIATITITLGYIDYRDSPSYALAQIENAIEDGNRLRFQQHVDLDLFLGTTVVQWMDQADTERLNPGVSYRFQAIPEELRSALADERTDAAVRELRRITLGAVDQGRLAAAAGRPRPDGMDAEDDLELAAVSAAAGVAVRNFEGVGDIMTEGDTALAELLFRQPRLDTTLVLQVRMARTDGRWRVVYPEEMDSYVYRLERLRDAHLAELSEERRAKVRQTLEVGTLERGTQAGDPWTMHYIYAPATNVSSEPVHVAYGMLKPPEWSNTAARHIIAEKRRLAPGESTILRMVMFENEDRTPPRIYMAPPAFRDPSARPASA